jgi:hypothetical protein
MSFANSEIVMHLSNFAVNNGINYITNEVGLKILIETKNHSSSRKLKNLKR